MCWPKRAVLKIGLVTCALSDVDLLVPFLGADWCTRENFSEVARGIVGTKLDTYKSKSKLTNKPFFKSSIIKSTENKMAADNRGPGGRAVHVVNAAPIIRLGLTRGDPRIV